MATLLLIDDDSEVLEINSKYLSKEGFEVYTSSNPLKGIDLVKKYNPDCILLDIMMPELDGIGLCTQIRSFSQVPIIFLTGKSDEDDKIRGLVTGADDYIIKPYSLKEVKARIDVLLRRAGISSTAAKQADTNIVTFGNLSINRISHQVFYKSEEIFLSNREYEVLQYFAEHPNTEVSFEQLGTKLFGTYNEVDRRSVMVNVSRLRKKFEGNIELENMIETVWSKGYKFVPH